MIFEHLTQIGNELENDRPLNFLNKIQVYAFSNASIKKIKSLKDVYVLLPVKFLEFHLSHAVKNAHQPYKVLHLRLKSL